MKFSPKNNFQIEEGVKYFWLWAFKYKKTKSILRVLNWFIFTINAFFRLLFNRCDIIIVSSHSMFPNLTAVLIKGIYKTPFIVDVRDVWPMTFTEVGNFSKDNIIIKLMSFAEKTAIKESNAVISTLPNYQLRIKEIIGDEKKLFLNIPQGYDFNLPVSKVEYEFFQKVDCNKLNIVYAGAIGLTNSLDTVFDCAKKMDKNKFMFYFIGEGDLLNDFKKKYNNQSQILFIDKIPKSHLFNILSRMDIGYDSASKCKVYNYGLSRQKWMDYMNASLPIVASFSGYKSILNEYNCGFFVEAESTSELMKTFENCYNLKFKNKLSEIGMSGNIALHKYRKFSTLASKLNKLLIKL